MASTERQAEPLRILIVCPTQAIAERRADEYRGSPECVYEFTGNTQWDPRPYDEVVFASFLTGQYGARYVDVLVDWPSNHVRQLPWRYMPPATVKRLQRREWEAHASLMCRVGSSDGVSHPWYPGDWEYFTEVPGAL